MYKDIKFSLSDAVCWSLDPISTALFKKFCPRFIDGFIVTIELLLISSFFGFILAVGMTLMRTSKRPWASIPAASIVYVFRGTPLLVQLWLVYFGIGSLGEERLGPILWTFFREAWWVGTLVLTLNTSAYVCEILRGGLSNVDKGQFDAGVAMGMPWTTLMRRIMLPQALRFAWPAYGNELILLMKGSALISTITVLDLMGQTRTVFARNFNLETYLYAAILYLILSGIITFGVWFVEQRLMHGVK